MDIFTQGWNIDESFIRYVSMGKVPGWGYIRKFGSGSCGTTLSTIWSGSSEQAGLYIYPDDAGEQIQVYSTNSNDTYLGSGARQLLVKGVGPNKEEFQEEIVQMNGTTPVILQKSWSRVNRVQVIDTGDPLRNIANYIIERKK